MRATRTATPRRRIVAGAVAVTFAALCLFVFVTRHGTSTSSARQGTAAQSTARSVPATPSADAALSMSPPSASPVASSPTAHASPKASPALVRTDDPAAYARAVAEALFGVTPSQVTRSAFLRLWEGELPSVVYSDAAAKGLTLSTQNGDAINNLTSWWIPTQAVWNSEATQNLTGRLVITSVSVPDYWVNAVADGTFRDPGLRMERVMGVLTQTYRSDAHHRATSSRSIVIDIALLCGPTQPGGCRLLAPQKPDSAGS